MIVIKNTSFISSYGHFVADVTMESDSVCGVYILLNSKMGVVYVGQSENIHNRLKSHCKNENKNWKTALCFPVKNKENRLTLEAYLIRYAKPKNNKAKPSVASSIAKISEKSFFDIWFKINDMKREMDKVIDIIDMELYPNHKKESYEN